MFYFFSKMLDINQKEIDRLSKTVARINDYDSAIKKLKDKDFIKKTEFFKSELAKGKTLEDILPEAFALVREASWRTIGLRPYDVQLMAAIALFEGRGAEQKKGDGKGQSAGPALYLRAFAGKG